MTNDKREQMRQKELKNNPTGTLSDGLNRGVSSNVSDLKWKETGVLILFLIVALMIASFIKKEPWEKNTELFRQEVLSIEKSVKTIHLTDVTPFEWDTVYSFSPYTPKGAIYETIGVEWEHISETVSEGMNQIVFLKDGEVVCYLDGYPENNGYGITFTNPNNKGYASSLSLKDDLVFKITRDNGVIILTKN